MKGRVFFLLLFWSNQYFLVCSIPAPPLANNKDNINPPAGVPQLVPNAASGGLVPKDEPSVAAARANHLAAHAAAIDRNENYISPSNHITNHFTQLHEAAKEEAANRLWPDMLTYNGLSGDQISEYEPTAAANGASHLDSIDASESATSTASDTATAADIVNEHFTSLYLSSNSSPIYPFNFNTSIYSAGNAPIAPGTAPIFPYHKGVIPASTSYIGIPPSNIQPSGTTSTFSYHKGMIPASTFYNGLAPSANILTGVVSPSSTLIGVIPSFLYITPISSYATGLSPQIKLMPYFNRAVVPEDEPGVDALKV